MVFASTIHNAGACVTGAARLRGGQRGSAGFGASEGGAAGLGTSGPPAAAGVYGRILKLKAKFENSLSCLESTREVYCVTPGA